MIAAPAPARERARPFGTETSGGGELRNAAANRRPTSVKLATDRTRQSQEKSISNAAGQTLPEAGATGVVAVRTDRIQLVAESPGRPDEAGVIVGSAYSGAYVDFVVQPDDGTSITVRDFTASAEFSRGDRVSFQVAGDAVLTSVERP